MSSIKTETHIKTQEVLDVDGNIIEQRISETTDSINITRNNEPDYIKLYTSMWCEFNQIPDTYRNLFLELITRMSYCDGTDLPHSQLVNTGKPWSDAIMKNLGWKKAMYQRGLKALCDCGAIKQISRGVYQINPNYAGKGEWRYNPRLQRGGVEDLVAQFNFRDGTVQTKIIWASENDGNATNLMDQEMFSGMDTKLGHTVTIKDTTIEKNKKEKAI